MVQPCPLHLRLFGTTYSPPLESYVLQQRKVLGSVLSSTNSRQEALSESPTIRGSQDNALCILCPHGFGLPRLKSSTKRDDGLSDGLGGLLLGTFCSNSAVRQV